MRTIELKSLSKVVRNRVLQALDEPVLVTDQGDPILVIRNLLDDDVADELIAQHPDFESSIERARQQKRSGQVKTLAELRHKYESE